MVALAVGIVLVLGLVALIVHLLLTWFEKRGWVYYRSTDRPRPQSLGLLEEIYQPSVSHVIEQQVTEETEAAQDPSGEGDPADGERSADKAPD
ncbi:MAG: hypothetical protein ACR2N7_07090 [Acidimicrobiia bacterium]